MTTKAYIVTNQAGANLRQCPSTTYPSKTPVGSKGYLDEVQVIPDWTATNSVGSETKYLPVLVDGKVLYCSAALLGEMPQAERLLAYAKAYAATMEAQKWQYQSGAANTYPTWAKAKAAKRSGCAAFVSWCLQAVGALASGKIVSHSAAGAGTGAKAVTGAGNLIGCTVTYPNKTYADYKASLRAGDVCVWDSNCAIYAGGGKWYDAGGPFSVNTKNKVYTSILCAPSYDLNNKILAVIRCD